MRCRSASPLILTSPSHDEWSPTRPDCFTHGKKRRCPLNGWLSVLHSTFAPFSEKKNFCPCRDPNPKCHHMTRLECAVLWVQPGLLGQFFWDHKFTPIYNTHSDPTFWKHDRVVQNVCFFFWKAESVAHTAKILRPAERTVLVTEQLSGDWPARLPDPNLCGFYLQDTSNDKVNSNSPRTRTQDDLQESIQYAASYISPAELQHATNNISV